MKTPAEIKRKSREARTRGVDTSQPVNKPVVDTPGFSTPKIRRRLTLGTEERKLILQDAFRLAQAGHTEFEICDFFGVGRSTLWRWKQDDPAFAEALKLGAEAANERVTQSLYHRAIGYTYKSEKIFQYEGRVIRAETVEHVPPDVTAMIFWQKNRDKENWADVNRLNVTGELAVTDKSDPRALAMAVLVALREAMEENENPTIEHQQAAE